MFDRRIKPNQQNTFAVGAAVFVIAGVLTTPALAATSVRFPCPEAADATLDVSVHVFAAELVNHDAPVASSEGDDAIAAIEELELAPSNSLLAPRAEAAIRNAFSSSSTESIAGTRSKSNRASDVDEVIETDSGMNTRLPGISDDDFLRYKKQMYRRDI